MRLTKTGALSDLSRSLGYSNHRKFRQNLTRARRCLEIVPRVCPRAAAGSKWPLEPGPEPEHTRKVLLKPAPEPHNARKVLLAPAPEPQKARKVMLKPAPQPQNARKVSLEPAPEAHNARRVLLEPAL